MQILFLLDVLPSTGGAFLYLKVNDSLNIIKAYGSADSGSIIIEATGLPSNQPNLWIVGRKDVLFKSTSNPVPYFEINGANDVVISIWAESFETCMAFIVNEFIVMYDGH
jgi:hypothetical protein